MLPYDVSVDPRPPLDAAGDRFIIRCNRKPVLQRSAGGSQPDWGHDTIQWPIEVKEPGRGRSVLELVVAAQSLLESFGPSRFTPAQKLGARRNRPGPARVTKARRSQSKRTMSHGTGEYRSPSGKDQQA